ncbi:MAG: GNAT family N-acetyltransferase [Bacteroidota bacterium]
MTILKAEIKDDEVLTAITKKSKAYWGYTEEQLLAWSQQLTITEVYIKDNEVYKLLVDGGVVGYYSYFSKDKNTVTLDNLFVLPVFISSGIGRLLMEDFLLRIKNTSAKKAILESEPNAEGFYAKFGFVKTGHVETLIKDRYLPIMELDIT